MAPVQFWRIFPQKLKDPLSRAKGQDPPKQKIQKLILFGFRSVSPCSTLPIRFLTFFTFGGIHA